MRNTPALTLLRLTGRRVVVGLDNAPEPGPFYRWVWRAGVDYFLDTDWLRQAMASAQASAATFSRDRFQRAWSAVFAGPEPEMPRAL